MKTEVKKPNKPIGSFASKSAKKENPFDKFANPRKKHDILNRRVKGEDRNVGRARAKVRETTRGVRVLAMMGSESYNHSRFS